MKTAFLLLTLSTASLAAPQQQFKVCTSDKDCKDNFYCRPTNDGKFSMCQPKSSKPDSAGNGKQWTVCKSNADCSKGLFCKPTNDKQFAMCQPNESCSKLYSQCAGKEYSGPSCCDNGNACKYFNEWYSQCVPASHAMEAEASCTNVSVEGDATYCVQGAICGGAGDQCPKKGDVAVADCIKTLNSYVDAGKCVAPVDATCQTIKTGAKGCVFGSSAPATQAPATQAPATQTPVTQAPSTQAPCHDTPATQAPNGQCAENYSQCNGQNWPFGVCCKDPNFSCNKKNEYLSLCEPKAKEMDAESSQAVGAWGQCGGKYYTGDRKCIDGYYCVSYGDFLSLCNPIVTGANEIDTWQQCGGDSFNADGKVCKPSDVCKKFNVAFSQCVPKPQLSAESSEVAVWQQCGGKNYNGDKTCTQGNSCVKINDWYSQCQPTPTAPNRLSTWSQCAGLANNFKANGKTCRNEDKCQKWNDYYSQCIPK